jgi:hypothetical protein
MFAGGTGQNEDFFPGERRAVVYGSLENGQDVPRLTHAPAALRAAGEVTGFRADAGPAHGFEFADIGLDGVLLPHLHIHRRRKKFAAAFGQRQRTGAHGILAETDGNLSDHVCGGGCENENIAFGCWIKMRVKVFQLAAIRFRPELVEDASSAYGGEGERGNKLGGGRTHGDMHLVSGFAQGADQLNRFVRRDAAGYTG